MKDPYTRHHVPRTGKIQDLLAMFFVLIAFAGCSTGRIATSFYSDSFTGKLSEDYSNTVTLNASIEYPESGFSGTGLQDVRCRIKKAVYGEKYAGLDLQDGLEMYFNDLLKDYREANLPIIEALEEEGIETAASLDWQYIIEAKFSGHGRNMVSYTVTRYEYTGGAHGMATTMAYTFDSRSGKAISEEELFVKGYNPVLTSLLTAHVRDGLENPDELVLFVDRIEPNGNFSAGNDGITYIYNPYEIAPYSSGTITVTVPWKELKGLLR
ncbi:MAG: DUF3298 and DUF4163 domain-containing protein [Bacteroidales bacterium]|nr:DUF3298 and DUF4163 domain-containing protein [Bacteroidales bacterium]